MPNNINKTVRNGLCMGCGVCQDICPKQCITIQHGRTNYPVVDDGICIECGKCIKVCSGLGVNINERAKLLYGNEDTTDNAYLGCYVACYKGYSTNYEIRYHSAAGGCLSQFLVWLLEKKFIDGAVVTRFKKEAPMKPEPFIAHTKADILSGKSSKYCVVSLDGILTEIKQTPGRYVIVGLPCHIHAIRKCIDVDKQVRDRIVGCFAIYCSVNKTMDSQRYLLYRYGVDEKILKDFAYRDDGCLGSMHFRDGKGENIVKPIYYLDYWFGMRSFFSIPRCGLCNDFFGELADVAFGDLNRGKETDDPIGINTLMSRSQYWDELLRQCQYDGNLWLEAIDEETMIEANGGCRIGKKGEGFYAQRNLRELFGKAVPEYDNLLQVHPSKMAYLKVLVGGAARFVGKHPSLWFIIKKLDKNKKN